MQHLLNHFGQQGIPCFFMIDFTKTHSHVYPLSQMPQDIIWSIDAKGSHSAFKHIPMLNSLRLKKK
jgi:hypothetical protein